MAVSLVALAQEEVDEDADRGDGDRADADQEEPIEGHGLVTPLACFQKVC